MFATLRHLKNKGVASVSFKQLDKFMANSDRQQFDFETFKAAFDSDPRLKNVVTNFDQDKVEFKQSEVDDLGAVDAPTGDVVGDMAARATDLSAELS